jgi:hypothetical protein
LPVETAGVAVGLQPELLVEKLIHILVAGNDGAPESKCGFGLHGNADQFLVVGLACEPHLGARQSSGRVTAGEVGAACSLKHVQLERMESSLFVLGPGEVAARQRFTGEERKR